MCWCTHSELCATEKVAKEDIKTFKVCLGLNNGNRSVLPYYFHSSSGAYEIGNTYKQTDGIQTRKPYDKLAYTEINEAFHSYRFDNTLFTLENHYFYGNREGVSIYHHDTYYKRHIDMLSSITFPLRFVKCTIPKGATYYENEIGEIASDQIRIDSIMTIDDSELTIKSKNSNEE